MTIFTHCNGNVGNSNACNNSGNNPWLYTLRACNKPALSGHDWRTQHLVASPSHASAVLRRRKCKSQHTRICVISRVCLMVDNNWHYMQKFGQFRVVSLFVLLRASVIKPGLTIFFRENSPATSHGNQLSFWKKNIAMPLCCSRLHAMSKYTLGTRTGGPISLIFINRKQK